MSNWRELLRAQQEQLGISDESTSVQIVNSNNMNEFQLSEDIDRILKKPLPSAATINMISQIKSSTSAPNSSRPSSSSNNYATASLAESNPTSPLNTNRSSQDKSFSFAKNRTSSVGISGKPSNIVTSNSARASSTGRVRSLPVSTAKKNSIATNSPASARSRNTTNNDSAYFAGGNDTNNENTMSEPSLLLAGAPDANNKYQQAKIKMLSSQVQEGVDLRRHLNEQIADLQKQLKTEKDETRNLKKRYS